MVAEASRRGLDWYLLTAEERLWRMLRLLPLMARVSPKELCGLLYSDGPTCITNVSATPEATYEMDGPQQYEAMSKRGWPEAIFHTHPGGRREPSTVDHQFALPNTPYLIGTPTGWAGAWYEGEQTMEVIMGQGTNDTVELSGSDEKGWGWERKSMSGQGLKGSGGFTTKAEAATDAQKENPDVYEGSGGALGGVGVADAVDGTAGATSAGTSSTGSVAGPASGTGSNSAGVGPTGV